MITPCPDITPEDVAVPWTLPLRPSRRSLLAGAAGAAGAALLTGCTGGGDPSGADSGIPLERRMREAAVRESEQLLERYDATLAAHPALAERLAPLRAAVAAHASALAFPAPEGKASASPGAAAGASRTPRRRRRRLLRRRPGAPAASREPVPAQPAEAVGALADAERSLSEARTIALAGAPGELARMLASVAACGAVHAYLLTTNPGAAS
ncbi:hypothetical protein [Streptomyces sp. RerS4]|uniref:hypothetical protein n=1 Tax=Streptomyces sp. RerS4 TaxID=2942449 RepID=UPI00201C580D|nr:hypothetical protein [Streptomyces sp. RerS4]UQX03265.1 hypothetical protein M4D82_24335 [Streptomyces sp. RerS4]